MRIAPYVVFPYKDTAMEAAHMEIERLHSANLLQQLLLDEATSRIRDLTKYQDNAAIIIARLKAQIRVLRKQERGERPSTKEAGLSVRDSHLQG